MAYRTLLVAIVGLAICGSTDDVAGQDASPVTKFGRIVSISGDKFVMTDHLRRDGKTYRRTAADDAAVNLDGMPCKMSDLRPGLRVQVTTSRENPTVAIRIDALDKAEIFSNMRDGMLVSATGDTLVMTNAQGDGSSFTLADPEVTCDGEPCHASDLEAGVRVRLTLDANDQSAVIHIEALYRAKDFAPL